MLGSGGAGGGRDPNPFGSRLGGHGVDKAALSLDGDEKEDVDNRSAASEDSDFFIPPFPPVNPKPG